jgi:hypothetical protein
MDLARASSAKRPLENFYEIFGLAANSQIAIEKKQAKMKKIQNTQYVIFVLMFIDESSERKTDQRRRDIAPSPWRLRKTVIFSGSGHVE